MWLALGEPLTGAIDAYPDWPRATWSGEVTREEAKPGILRRSLPDGYEQGAGDSYGRIPATVYPNASSTARCCQGASDAPRHRSRALRIFSFSLAAILSYSVSTASRQ